jgi:5-methylcytosine-specific restriction protein A
MPQSIPRVLNREHVLRALAGRDAGTDHPFGSPTGYELVHDGRRYPPKAVIGQAHLQLAVGTL